MRHLPLAIAACLLMLVLLVPPRAASAPQGGADPALVEQGRALARAGDCVSCHGATLKGGAPVASPMGKIYASNITPDRRTGIGGWTLAQFTDLLRKGKAPDRHIYPAMPYTAYTGLSDQQIRALYSYLMLGVAPVAYTPPPTRLPFPFVRPAMIGWNALFLTEGKSSGAKPASTPQQQRGRLLVETLEHCTVCHTPRGMLMQENEGRHLGGSLEAGWWAPNITPAGIGHWSDAQLATFLTTGHTEVAVAGDDMGTAVEYSLSKLPPADIAAIIAYLRVVPAVSPDTPKPAAARPAVQRITAIEPAGQTSWQQMLGHDTTQGDILYQSACASCHGMDGNGSADFGHPSLRRIGSVTGPYGATMVQAIAQGIHREVGGRKVLMPAFRPSFSDAQIAALANYVRSNFGGIQSNLTGADVATIVDGEIGTPWLIHNAHWLSILAIVVVVAILAWLVWRLMRRRRGRGGEQPA